MDTQARSWSMWSVRAAGASGNNMVAGLCTQNGSGTLRQFYYHGAPAVSGFQPKFTQSWSGVDGVWHSGDLPATTRVHIAVTYDRGGAAPGNDPLIYVNGTSVTVTETATPTGTADTGDDTLKCGENGGGSEDAAATIAYLCIDSQIWTTAQINRARWWGRPHGGLPVYHPFLTTKLDDEGTAAETLTATGSTAVAFATPVVRPGSALLGMGIGW